MFLKPILWIFEYNIIVKTLLNIIYIYMCSRLKYLEYNSKRLYFSERIYPLLVYHQKKVT